MPVTTTFARASIAYKQDGSQVAADQPRYESGHSGQAIMVEEGTTNLLRYSQDISNSAWVSQSGGTTFITGVTDPFGGTQAQTVTFSGGNLLLYQELTVSAFSYTSSFWVKGVVGETIGAGLEGNDPLLTLNGQWQKVTKTATFTAGTHFACDIHTYEGATARVVQYFGAQLEQKAYATSYIPTTAVVVTRAAESLTIPTAGLLNAAEGTIACWVKPGSGFGTNLLHHPLISIGSDDNTKLALQLRGDGSGNINAELFHGYGSGYEQIRYALAKNLWVHLAVVWQVGVPSKLYVNGIPVQTTVQNSAYIFTVSVNIGSGFAEYSNSLIDDLRFYNKALTAAEVAQVYGGQA